MLTCHSTWRWPSPLQSSLVGRAEFQPLFFHLRGQLWLLGSRLARRAERRLQMALARPLTDDGELWDRFPQVSCRHWRVFCDLPLQTGQHLGGHFLGTS
jgi:hypothetical protein